MLLLAQHQLSISASLSFSTATFSIFILAQLDLTAPRAAPTALSRCLILLHSAVFALELTAGYCILLGISTRSNVFEICLRHAARTCLEGSPKPKLTVKNP